MQAWTQLCDSMRRCTVCRTAMALVCALLPIMLGTGCTPTPPEIRIGTNIWAGYEPLYLARSLGLFKHSGVRLVEYPSSTESMNALRDGSIEAAALTLDEVLSLAQDGVDLRIVLLLDISNGADAVVAQPGITSPEALRGHSIGVESTAVGGYIVDRMLDLYGLKLSEVHIVPLGSDEHVAAFTQHRVDAVVTFEPIKSRLLADGGKVIFDSSQIPGEIIDVLAVRADVLQAHPHALDRLDDAWFRALDYMQQKPDDAIQRMQSRLRLSSDALQRTYHGLQLGTRQLNRTFFDNRQQSAVKKAAHMMRVMHRKGLLHNDVDVTALFANPPTQLSGARP